MLTYLLGYFTSVFKHILTENVSGKCDAFIISVFIELLSEVLVALQQICIMYFPLLQSFFSQVNLISTCQILKQYLLVPSSVSFKMHNCFFPHLHLLSVCWIDWDSKQICKIFRKDEIKCSLSCHLYTRREKSIFSISILVLFFSEKYLNILKTR